MSTTEQTVKDIVGYKTQSVVTVTPEKEKSFRAKIKKLNDAPITAIQRLINPKIVDFKAKFSTKGKYDCDDGFEGCKVLQVHFLILFFYNIIGFQYSHPSSSGGMNWYFGNRGWSDHSRGIYTHSSFFGRKGGYIKVELIYKHHLGTHKTKNNPFTYKYEKTPFCHLNLYPHSTKYRSGGDRYINKEIIDLLMKFRRDYQPTLDNCDLWMKKYDNYTDSKTGYKYKILYSLRIHPHWFLDHKNFCTGNQTSTNQHLKEGEIMRNPISYIKGIIESTDYVTQNDCQGGFEYFNDVFINSNWIFDNKFLRIIKNAISEFKNHPSTVSEIKDELEAFYPTADHLFSWDCYCSSCLSIRGACIFSTKIDFDKIIEDQFVQLDFDMIDKIIKNLKRGKAKVLDSRIIEQFNGNSYEEIRGHKYYKFSELLEVLVEQQKKDHSIKLSMWDWRNRLMNKVSSSSGRPILFIESTSGEPFNPNAISDAQSFQRYINQFTSSMRDYSNASSLIMGDRRQAILTELQNFESKRLSITDFTPYLPDLTEEEQKKVDEIIKECDKYMS